MWWPRHRRRHAIARQRLLHADESVVEATALASTPTVRVRARHRAPAPRLPFAARLPRDRRAAVRAVAAALAGVFVLVVGTTLWRAPTFRIHGAQVRGNT